MDGETICQAFSSCLFVNKYFQGKALIWLLKRSERTFHEKEDQRRMSKRKTRQQKTNIWFNFWGVKKPGMHHFDWSKPLEKIDFIYTVIKLVERVSATFRCGSVKRMT